MANITKKLHKLSKDYIRDACQKHVAKLVKEVIAEAVSIKNVIYYVNANTGKNNCYLSLE